MNRPDRRLIGRNGLILALILILTLAARLKGALGPLNEDESLFALQNLIPLSRFFDWWSTLEHPVLFYMSGKASVALLGRTNLALRIGSLIAGLALVWLCYFLGKRLSDQADGKISGLAAAFLAATSFTLVGYSQEYLPYAFSFLTTALLAAAALWVRENPTWRRGLALVGLSALSSSSAHTSLFVEGGVGFVLFVDWLVNWRRTGRPREKLAGAAVYAAWLALAGAIMVLPSARLIFVPPGANYVTNVYADSYWSSLGFFPGIERLLSTFLDVTVRYLPFTGQAHTANIFLALTLFTAAVGLSAAWRSEKGRPVVVILIGTLLAQTAAMAIGMWSLRPKHSLYLAPFFLIFAGCGVVVIGGWLREKRQWPALVLGILILSLLPVRALVKANMASDTIYGWTGFVGKMKSDLKDGDAVFVDTYSAPLMMFHYLPHRADLAVKLQHERRRLYPFNEIPVDVVAGQVELLGRRVFLVLGGEDLDPLLRSGAKRIWILCDYKYSRAWHPRFKPELKPPYRRVYGWRAEAHNGSWALYQLDR